MLVIDCATEIWNPSQTPSRLNSQTFSLFYCEYCSSGWVWTLNVRVTVSNASLKLHHSTHHTQVTHFIAEGIRFTASLFDFFFAHRTVQNAWAIPQIYVCLPWNQTCISFSWTRVIQAFALDTGCFFTHFHSSLRTSFIIILTLEHYHWVIFTWANTFTWFLSSAAVSMLRRLCLHQGSHKCPRKCHQILKHNAIPSRKILCRKGFLRACVI